MTRLKYLWGDAACSFSYTLSAFPSASSSAGVVTYQPLNSKFSPGDWSVRRPNIPCPWRSVSTGVFGFSTDSPQPNAVNSTILFQSLLSFPFCQLFGQSVLEQVRTRWPPVQALYHWIDALKQWIENFHHRLTLQLKTLICDYHPCTSVPGDVQRFKSLQRTQIE